MGLAGRLGIWGWKLGVWERSKGKVVDYSLSIWVEKGEREWRSGGVEERMSE